MIFTGGFTLFFLVVHLRQFKFGTEYLVQAANGLAALEVPVEWHLSAGIGHGIDQEGLRHGGEFLARRLAAAR